MQLRQLKYVLEVYRCGNHVSAAAGALNTSQPGLSKQIQQLEHELGFAIFERQRNRLVGLTEPGREVITIAQRILNEVQSLRSLRDDRDATESGTLVIGTTHTLARYVLPPVVAAFLPRYPKIRISLKQGNPTQICEAVAQGEADLAVGTDTMRPFPSLVRFPCFELKRSLIARRDHPLLHLQDLTLEDIAQFPLIAYDPYRSGRWNVLDAFRQRGLEPNVVFEAVDADVAKTYVELGLGIAILASVAVDPKHDLELGGRDASHLFDSSQTYISVRAGSYVRRSTMDFIQSLWAPLTPKVLKKALSKSHGSPS